MFFATKTTHIQTHIIKGADNSFHYYSLPEALLGFLERLLSGSLLPAVRELFVLASGLPEISFVPDHSSLLRERPAIPPLALQSLLSFAVQRSNGAVALQGPGASHCTV